MNTKFAFLSALSCLSLAAASLAAPAIQTSVESTAGRGCSPDWVPTFGGRPGMDGPVYALTVFDAGSPALYAGGSFRSAGGVAAMNVAKWDGVSWSALGNGVDGDVFALTVFDDGGGSALYAGGKFTSAGSVAANHVAKWDGTSWSALGTGGSGTNGEVLALAVFDDGSGPALYAGGNFTTAGVVAANYISKWDGVTWSPLVGGANGTNSVVAALTVFDDGSGPALCVGGYFTNAGGVPANYVARWDGTNWSQLGLGGNGTNNAVLALTVFDDGGSSGRPALHAGGVFTNAGGLAANYVAKWDGTSWSPLGVGVNYAVTALAAFDDGSGGGRALYAAGWFLSAGGFPASSIARWDGSSWSPLGSGIDGGVEALAVFDDKSGQGAHLFAGGSFESAGGVAASWVASWSGSSWESVGEGANSLNRTVVALETLDDGSGGGTALYAGGYFTSAGGTPASLIAKWDGTGWTTLGAGLSGTPFPGVLDLEVFDDGSAGGPAIYAGGYFTSAGGVAVNYIAKWDGTSWSPLGAVGMDNAVYSLAVFDDGNGPALYAGGDFRNADGVPANFIAKWDGTSWSAMGSGMSSGVVHALAVFDDGAGGGPALYAGGNFIVAGGVQARRIAKWDGTSWSKLGSGMAGQMNSVTALKVFDDGSGPALYAGGAFASAGGVQATNIAKWDGVSWSSLAGGGLGINFPVPQVRKLAVFDDGGGGGPALYAGGSFTIAGGMAANNIARWDGSNWSALASGMDTTVFALEVFDDANGAGPALYAGGLFTVSPSGDSHLAKWGCAPPTRVARFCSAKSGLSCGPVGISAEGISSATAYSGFVVSARRAPSCKFGVLLYNTSQGPALPFGGGTLCVSNKALGRAGPTNSMGTPGNNCDGQFAIDMNAFAHAASLVPNCDGSPSFIAANRPATFLRVAGTTLFAQYWGRDSLQTGDYVSDGLSWTTGP